MKRTIAIIAALACWGAAQGQGQKNVPAKLTEATVFFKGAELTHTASASLARGENELRIEGLSPAIDVASLKISATGGVVVSAHEFSVDYLSGSKEPSAAVRKMEDSLAIYKASQERTQSDIQINSDMLSFLQEGIKKNVSGSEKGLPTDELAKAMEYYRTKSGELQARAGALNKQKEQLAANIKRINAQLTQERTRDTKRSGVLRLSLSSPSAQTSNFTVAYFTATAGWTPYYDINIASVEKPIQIAARSKVWQTTGLDWEKVRLTLSTATPSNGKTAPLFTAWFLEQWRPKPQPVALAAQNSFSYGYMNDDTSISEALAGKMAGVNVRVRGSSAIKEESAEPLYIINGQPATQADLSAIDPSMIKNMEVLKDASATSLYGSRGANGVIVVTLKGGMDDYVNTSESAISVVYNIDLPYTIPGSGKVQNIDLGTKQTAAEYKYYCAPKLDPAVYLIAEIAGWESLGLLSGKANVTYEGTYVGETDIDASSTQEKLALTLGADKRVAVKREKMQDFSSTKTLGTDVQKIFTWKITVKNNRTTPIQMVVKDQYPLSTQKNIEVLLRKETTPWTVNKEDLGVITWEEELAGGATKTYQLSYSVKYPKDMTLNF